MNNLSVSFSIGFNRLAGITVTAAITRILVNAEMIREAGIKPKFYFFLFWTNQSLPISLIIEIDFSACF